MENKKGKISLNDEMLEKVSGGFEERFQMHLEVFCTCGNSDPNEYGYCNTCGCKIYNWNG